MQYGKSQSLLCPQIPLAKDICSHVGTLDMACLRILRPLEEVPSQRTLCMHARSQILILSNYAQLISDVMTALYTMTTNVQELVVSDRDPEDVLPRTLQEHDALDYLLRRAVDNGNHASDSLYAFEREVVSTLSFPRIIQSLLVFLLGPNWSHREVARSEVPPVIRAVCADLQSVVASAARLRDCVVVLRQRFSVSQLGLIRNSQGQTREDVGMLVKQAAWELYTHARSAKETADFIGRLAVEPSETPGKGVSYSP
ncbi:hypothetical protein K523DRAFT_421218 [Schizophyllum commune Tattone D]|nr:hypothetical protein K523DRAFT_421218 [Schizophyllum commune Tattone D]